MALSEEEKKQHKRESAIKRYYEKREEILEKQKQRYSQNKNIILKCNKQWKKDNPNYMKEWREEHKDEIKEYNKTYHAKLQLTPIGKAQNLVSSYKQRDEKYNRGECTITAEWIVENIFSAKRCHYCRREFDFNELGCDRKDSSLPHTPDNCVPCCQPCNSKKGSMSYEEFMKKMLEENP